MKICHKCDKNFDMDKTRKGFFDLPLCLDCGADPRNG